MRRTEGRERVGENGGKWAGGRTSARYFVNLHQRAKDMYHFLQYWCMIIWRAEETAPRPGMGDWDGWDSDGGDGFGGVRPGGVALGAWIECIG